MPPPSCRTSSCAAAAPNMSTSHAHGSLALFRSHSRRKLHLNKSHTKRLEAEEMDSSACLRVSLLVVALGLMCTCCDSFFVPPAGPLIMRQQTAGPSSWSRLSSTTAGPASRPSGPIRMMAGDPDVSLYITAAASLVLTGPHVWFCCVLLEECGVLLHPHPLQQYHRARSCFVRPTLARSIFRKI